MTFNDHFSDKSADYRVYRPVYPPELFEYLSSVAPGHELAWDCATGNGQAAIALSRHFLNVHASDASESQIANAIVGENIRYQVEAAEKSSLMDKSVDLITVAQALHWFDLAAFEKEVRRVLKTGGVLAVWTYGLMHISGEIDRIIYSLYEHTLGDFWPAERKLVENGYSDVDFAFHKTAAAEFNMQQQWDCSQALGYLHTWSATKKYLSRTGIDPVREIKTVLSEAWGDSRRLVTWPLVLKLWRRQET